MSDRHDEQPVLDYLSPDEQARERRETFRRVVGAIYAAITVVVLVFLFIMSNFNWRGNPKPTNFVPTSVALLIAMAIIGSPAYMHWKRDRSVALLQGLLIGVGVGLLIDGICWAVNTNR